MSLEANKALVHAFADQINAKDLEAACTLVSPSHVEHGLHPELPSGAEAVRAFFSMLLAGFPDARTTILDTLAEGDRVVLRARIEGTQTGPFMGIPPTGRRAKWSLIDIYRLADGKIVEHWVEVDTLGLMQQLGLVPPPLGR
jgi:predicted ester cyclase